MALLVRNFKTLTQKHLQVRMLDASRNNQTEYFLCHLCLSVFKKSIREIETDSVSYPSLFISETLQFIQV